MTDIQDIEKFVRNYATKFFNQMISRKTDVPDELIRIYESSE